MYGSHKYTSIVSQFVLADTGKMWTCEFLGSPDVHLETFNKIKISCVLPMFPKLRLYKNREHVRQEFTFFLPVLEPPEQSKQTNISRASYPVP